ncbi:conserved hypothetical protein [Sporisorium reilianum SRZ2]|uniref:Uncharacterized protein n=1 Tax=Sporisorium reilianum (strain SRZ2) TaxID=999809 RepID=E6ZRZ0_SPORE|nr:conserved hypothetical protein [Sporisorium reilianum SRZ2]
MVHPLVITAAATAGIGAAVAFEVAVFGPWREENWPNGFGQGVRDELLKFRREFEEAVTEIRDEFRERREGRRRAGGSGNRHRRLSDGELDDFRRGIGEEASSESAQHEFEMHERQASAYRDRLRASMSGGFDHGLEQPDSRLRRRRPAGGSGAEGEPSSPSNNIKVPVVDIRTPTSPELPHHSLGEASPSVKDAASLPSDSRFNSVGSTKAAEAVQQETTDSDAESGAAKNGLLGLDFGPKASASLDEQAGQAPASDPFADIVDGTASSWHAVFSDRANEPSNETVPEGVTGHSSPAPSVPELPEEAHVVLDTNGLSQTLSDQQHSFHDLYTGSSNASDTHDSPYRSNRALHSPSQNARSNGSRSETAESEPDFEVLSDTAGSEGRWQHLEMPPSPTVSSGSEGIAVRGMDAISVSSDGQDSWAELSEPGSDVEGFARRETSVGSPRG